jgi:hypothetical protein
MQTESKNNDLCCFCSQLGLCEFKKATETNAMLILAELIQAGGEYIKLGDPQTY